ncbi:addiction module antidote protein [uncultured Slackia sp.]|jgi:probable addiction module antidote protein|uniref:addiction module antidote protein n=1 Tax=uncultured Slackia sp. TaxID=665903 RepID=UPI0025E2C792|nr:addiction module antidote protein [uncultured Slackia sp.]
MKTRFSEFDIAEYLKSEEDIAEYLNAVAEYDDPEFFQAALGDVARARGMTNMAKQTGLSRENLYRALSKDGNPRLKTLEKIFDALGIEVVFRKKTPKDKSSNPVG